MEYRKKKTNKQTNKRQKRAKTTAQQHRRRRPRRLQCVVDETTARWPTVSFSREHNGHRFAASSAGWTIIVALPFREFFFRCCCCCFTWRNQRWLDAARVVGRVRGRSRRRRRCCCCCCCCCIFQTAVVFKVRHRLQRLASTRKREREIQKERRRNKVTDDDDGDGDDDDDGGGGGGGGGGPKVEEREKQKTRAKRPKRKSKKKEQKKKRENVGRPALFIWIRCRSAVRLFLGLGPPLVGRRPMAALEIRFNPQGLHNPLNPTRSLRKKNNNKQTKKKGKRKERDAETVVQFFIFRRHRRNGLGDSKP